MNGIHFYGYFNENFFTLGTNYQLLHHYYEVDFQGQRMTVLEKMQ